MQPDFGFHRRMMLFQEGIEISELRQHRPLQNLQVRLRLFQLIHLLLQEITHARHRLQTQLLQFGGRLGRRWAVVARGSHMLQLFVQFCQVIQIVLATSSSQMCARDQGRQRHSRRTHSTAQMLFTIVQLDLHLGGFGLQRRNLVGNASDEIKKYRL